MDKKNSKVIDLIKFKGDRKNIEKHYLDLRCKKKVVVTSGYFDPLHHGHIELFKKSRQLGDYLIVVINNDDQAIQKKGFVFMPHEEKAKIIAELRCVDEVFISLDKDTSQCETLKFLKPHIFAKGGDRFIKEIPETSVCLENRIQIIEGIGKKVQSSSELIRKAKKFKN